MSPTPPTLLPASGVQGASDCLLPKFGSSQDWWSRSTRQLPVICNDGGPAQYHCYLFGNGVVRTGQQFPLNIETERNIASLAGRLCRNLFEPYARYGHLWTSNYDGPTNEQLRDPSNWSLAYCDPRLIPLVDLIVNVDVACLPTTATCG